MATATLATPASLTERWMTRLRAECLQRGWDLGELARRAGVSRTTLYHLERGSTQRPQTKTLHRLARALEIDPAEFESLAEGPLRRTATTEHGDGRDAAPERAAADFDRRTNRVVRQVVQARPQLFRHWQADDWDELYSTFGTGGALTEDGVEDLARRINRKRETIQKVQVLLETHLEDVAVRLIDTLFQSVRPRSNLHISGSLQAVLAQAGVHPRPAATEEFARRSEQS